MNKTSKLIAYSVMLSVTLAFALAGCINTCPVADPAPPYAYFRVTDLSSHTDLSSARLYWFSEGSKLYDSDFKVGYRASRINPVTHRTEVDSTKPVLSSSYLIGTVNSGISRFYIEYCNRPTDTLDITVESRNSGTKRCPDINYHVAAVTQNGRSAQADTTYVSNLVVWELVKPQSFLCWLHCSRRQ